MSVRSVPWSDPEADVFGDFEAFVQSIKDDKRAKPIDRYVPKIDSPWQRVMRSEHCRGLHKRVSLKVCDICKREKRLENEK